MIAKPTTRKREVRADQTQKRILRAAIQEFSTHGLSGARTDRIAESAKVNKALLYYYFKSKQGLYAAAIEGVSATVVENALAEFDPKYSAGEKLAAIGTQPFRSHPDPAGISKPDATGDDSFSKR